ncbi:MAG: hypothetical protein FRX49_00108 [Trebouxia sp. A1-2]|nr:MAG: hypothetical protein FRX49_00108 [Trebouxia sp. A1-2]
MPPLAQAQAPLARAVSTSVVVTGPTPSDTTFTPTSLSAKASTDCRTASTEPCMYHQTLHLNQLSKKPAALWWSPAWGTPFRPAISTGCPGMAFFMLAPAALRRLRTLPHWLPTTTNWPTSRLPFFTMAVATGPCPLSSLASTTTASAGRLGLAFSSSPSACIHHLHSDSRQLSSSGVSGGANISAACSDGSRRAATVLTMGTSHLAVLLDEVG